MSRRVWAVGTRGMSTTNSGSLWPEGIGAVRGRRPGAPGLNPGYSRTGPQPEAVSGEVTAGPPHHVSCSACFGLPLPRLDPHVRLAGRQVILRA